MRPFTPRICTVLLRGIALVAIVVLPLTQVQYARSQGTSGDVNVDSLVALLQDSLGGRITLVPNFNSKMRGNVSSMSWENAFRNRTNIGFKSTANVFVQLDKKVFRLQDRIEETKILGGSFQHRLASEVSFDAFFNDSRRLNRVIALGGGVRDLRFDDQTLGGSVLYKTSRPRRVDVPYVVGLPYTGGILDKLFVGDLGWDGRATSNLTASEKTFKTDDTFSRAANGGVQYKFFDQHVTFKLRGAYKVSDEKSQPHGLAISDSLQDIFNNLGSKEDSVVADVAITTVDSMILSLSYQEHHAERQFADQARGALGAQVGGAENVFPEAEKKKAITRGVRLQATPLPRTTLTMSADRSVRANDYLVQKSRVSQTAVTRLMGDFGYNARWGTSIGIGLENRKQERYLGPLSVGSYNERDKKLTLRLLHMFTQTMSVNVTAINSINQKFYWSPDENPRDADQVDLSLSARINSSPFPKFRAGISIYAAETQFVNIKAAQSSDNRVKQRYDFKPNFAYKVTDRVTIEQTYGLAIEFTDYDNRSSDNFLDRNTTFSNVVRASLTDNVRFDFLYDYRFHDRGSYLPRPGEEDKPDAPRFLSVDREDRTDRMQLTMRYSINSNIAVEAKQNYSRKVDRNIGSSRPPRTTTEGGIEGGFVGSFNWGKDRTFQYSVKKANRFGPFASEAQKEYWLVNAELKYAF